MSGNTLGKLFCVTSFGESHGPAIGCVVDGCPPGLELTEADIQHDLDRRKPGTSRHVTQRRESDTVEILSGVFEGKTTGTPIGLLIRNEDQRSKDYGRHRGHLPSRPRRLHLLAEIRHPRLSRRRACSARETAVRVAAGAIARKWLHEHHRRRRCAATWRSSGPIESPFKTWDAVRCEPVLRAPTPTRCRELEAFMDALRKSGDSIGARITVVADGVPVGLGRAGVRPARCRHRPRPDEHQRGEGRGDRRGLRASWRRRAASTATK